MAGSNYLKVNTISMNPSKFFYGQDVDAILETAAVRISPPHPKISNMQVLHTVV